MAARRAAHHRVRPRTATVWPPAPIAGQDVYLVPAFVGLGAPYWRPEARGALFGLTRASGPNELARAALEAVCYQTRDLLEAMRGDWSADAKSVLRVDGGMVASDWTMQFLADMLDAPVERPTDPGDDGAGCGLARRSARRRVAGCGGLRQAVEARARLQAHARRGGAGAQVCRLAACRARSAAACGTMKCSCTGSCRGYRVLTLAHI